MNKILLPLLLLLCSNVNALEITYPIFKTCYLDVSSVPHQVTRNFVQAVKDAILGGRGVVFNQQPPNFVTDPTKYFGFYMSSPIIPSTSSNSCNTDYTTGKLECNIHGSRSTFWNLNAQSLPMFYEEFVQENINMGTTRGQFDDFIALVVMAMQDANNGYVHIDGFGKLRTTESGMMVGYSGIEFVDFNSFMATSASVSPYTGNCADFVGKGTSNPETLGIGDIIAGGFKIENITGTAPVPIGTSAIVSVAVVADGYYTLRYQFPNDFFGTPKTIKNTDTGKITLKTGNGNEQIELSIFNKDLLPTTVTNQPIMKPFRIGTTGPKDEKKRPELKLKRNAGYKYECSVSGGTCTPSGGTTEYSEGVIATDSGSSGGTLTGVSAKTTGGVSGGTLTGVSAALTGSVSGGTLTGLGSALNGNSSATLQGFGSILMGNVTGGFLGTDNNRWTIIFQMPATVTSVTIKSIDFYIDTTRVTTTNFFGGTCASGTLANLNDNNLTTTCVVNTTSHPGKWVMFTGFFSVTQRGITKVVMQMNSTTINNFLVAMQNGSDTSLSPASTTITNNYTTPCNYVATTDTHACSSDTHSCSLFDNHACSGDTHACSTITDTHACSGDTHACSTITDTHACSGDTHACSAVSVSCDWHYEEEPSCTATPCSCSGGTGGSCTVNRVADPLATLGFLTPPNVLVTPWRDDYFETDASFGDLDSGNYSAYCAFEEKTFKVQVVKTGTGTGTVTVNPTGGTSCGVDCLRYPENTQIGLVAVPSSDSTMAGWSGCDAVFDLVSDKDCTVTFNLKPPPSASSCTTENVCIDSFRALLVATLSQYGTTVIDDTGYLTVTLEDGTIISAFLTRIVKDGDPAPGSVVTWPEVVTRTYSASYVPDQYDPLETVFLAASPTDAEITPLSDMDGNGLVDYEVRVNGTPDYVGMMYITSVH